MAKQAKSEVSILIKQGIWTLLLGAGATFLMFYLCAKLIVSQSIAQSMFWLFATGAICIGCCVSSVILALQRKKGGLICGLICFAAFGIVLLLSCYTHDVQTISSAMFMRLALLCVSGCLGGVLGVSRAQKRARKRRKA